MWRNDISVLKTCTIAATIIWIIQLFSLFNSYSSDKLKFLTQDMIRVSIWLFSICMIDYIHKRHESDSHWTFTTGVD